MNSALCNFSCSRNLFIITEIHNWLKRTVLYQYLCIIFCFQAYKEALESDEYQNCTDAKRTKDSKPCNVDLSALGPCYDNSTDFKYGYDEEKPCIFMKMNRVS